MTKTEFLSLLEQRLMVLNDEERSDLLSEYQQHIEMKIQSGLSEEDAIADFGDPDALIRELLEAYHLNTSYSPESAGPSGVSSRLSRFLDTLKSGFSKPSLPKLSLREHVMHAVHFVLRCIGFLVLLFVAALALGCIAGSAASLVFLLQGYRILGLFLVVLGCALLSAAISLLLMQFVFQRGGADQ